MSRLPNRFAASEESRSTDVDGEVAFQELKQHVHERLIATLDFAAAQELPAAELEDELTAYLEELLAQEGLACTKPTFTRLLAEIPAEMYGLGPLEPLLADPNVNDILVNHAHEVFVERKGQLERTDVVFANNSHLLRIIQRIASHVGRRVDETTPFVDARLADGSRVNAIIPPLSLDGPKLSIRRFRKALSSVEQLVAIGTLSAPMADFLRQSVLARKNILISGGTGSGKTTMLNALSSCIPHNQRIITIEDSAELQLMHPHVARLETRPLNSENAGEFTQRDLVRNSLRMRPDRIIVGEVRGAEALDMLQAMNTGHEGSLTTIHANDAIDAISRLEMMVAMTALELPAAVVRSYICSGIAIIVHLVRYSCGRRCVSRIVELERNGDAYCFRDIFRFRKTGITAGGETLGEFHTCELPRCLSDFRAYGLIDGDTMFSPAEGNSDSPPVHHNATAPSPTTLMG